MAIEFGSRKENFDNFKVYETTLAGRPFKVEMGKMCGLSNASALIRYGETCVMCNVVMSPKPREGVDFFPLNVEYEEKLYAAGRIPGSFMRREGRPSLPAVLASRLIDRPMRPLFPKDYRNDVTLNNMVMSVDPECRPELVAMIGAAIATCISDIPFDGPCAMTQVGMIDGEFIINPSQEQWKKGDLNLTVASTREKVIMIEAGANEIPEATMIEAIYKAHEVNQTIIAFIDKIVAEVGKKKHEYTSCAVPAEMFEEMKKIVSPSCNPAISANSIFISSGINLSIGPLYFSSSLTSKYPSPPIPIDCANFNSFSCCPLESFA